MSIAKSKKTTGKAKSARTTGCLDAERPTIETTDSSTRPLSGRAAAFNHKSGYVCLECDTWHGSIYEAIEHHAKTAH